MRFRSATCGNLVAQRALFSGFATSDRSSKEMKTFDSWPNDGFGGNSNDSKTKIAATRMWKAPVTASTPKPDVTVVPRPPSHHAMRADCRSLGIVVRRAEVVIIAVPVPAPFPDVACHVTNAMSVLAGTLRVYPYRCRVAEITCGVVYSIRRRCIASPRILAS